MAKLFDYLTLRGDVTFKYSPFNIVDSLILSQISYIDFSNSAPRFISEKQLNLQDVVKNVFSTVKKEEMILGLIVPNTILELADAGKDTLRYKDVKISNYVDIVDKKRRCQFSAMCFHLPNNTIYIAFRGTDDSLIGWQEDLDMLCKFPIPAQVEAAKYVDKIAKIFPTSVLILGGHSKGGNLAAYASIYCKDNVKIRIKDVYCFDSPGFDLNNIDENKYKIIKKRITRIIPQSSVIGLIFDNIATKTIIVKSDGKGITQHDAFTWHITHNYFVQVDSLDENATKFDEALKKMIGDLNEEDRYDLASNCYDLVKRLNQETLLEIQKNPISFMKEVDVISPKNGKLFMQLAYNVIRFKQF